MGGCFWLARPGLGALVREAGFNGRGLQLAKLAIANPYRSRPSICKDQEGMEAVEVENEAGKMEVNDKRKRKRERLHVQPSVGYLGTYLCKTCVLD